METPGEPVFLTSDDVRTIHDAELAESRGLPGVRDENALESAVAQPRQVYAYARGDFVDIASR